MIPIIYAIDGKSFPKPPSSCEHTVTQVVTKASRTVGKGALLNKELLAEKEKINCVWLYMTAREYAQLRQMGAGKKFLPTKLLRRHHHDKEDERVLWLRHYCHGGEWLGSE